MKNLKKYLTPSLMVTVLNQDVMMASGMSVDLFDDGYNPMEVIKNG